MWIETFLNILERERLIAILRTGHTDRARKAMQAAIRGGFRILEFTLSIPDVYDLIKEFSANPELITGAGTVLTGDQAERAVNAGARFLVSPVLNVELVHWAMARDIPFIPGTHTPTEMWQAVQAGAPLQKVFPRLAHGPDDVRALLRPMPFLRLVPTHGVTPENFIDYLDAGVFGVGLVSSLFDPIDIESEQYNRIERRARLICERFHQWQSRA